MAAGATATMDRRVGLGPMQRDHDTNQSASHREHEAFRQHLADESAPAPRPDGQANRDLRARRPADRARRRLARFAQAIRRRAATPAARIASGCEKL